jgi:spermidine synthase
MSLILMENNLHYLLLLVPLAILGFQQIENFSNQNEPKELNLNTLEKLVIQSHNPIITCINNNNKHYVKKYDDVVTLDDHSSKFQLSTFKNEFSYGRLFVDFILQPSVNKQSILVMGFGLGGIPLELSLDYKIKKIDCVDINICMFKLYNTLISNKPNKLHYYLSDAKEYLKKKSKTYDIIIDDVFDFLKKEFYDFELAKNRLNENGWLLINMHSINDYNNHESKLKKLFKKVLVDTRRNICVFCQN